MGTIIIIGIIVFVILIFIKAIYSNDNSSSSTSTYDHQKKLEYKREEKKYKKQEHIQQKIEVEQRRKKGEQQRREFELERQKKQAEEQRQLAQCKKNWKDDWHNFKRLIEENRITKLYHFTDRANLASIKRNGGLYSWDYCERNNIPISLPGGDNLSRKLDIKNNLQNYVRLCFTKKHPMMFFAKNQGRLNAPVILEINPEVIYWKGTKYSDMNATKTGHSKGDTLEDFKRIKFDVVKQRNQFNVPDELQKYYQAEIMVKEHIPLSQITNFDKFHIENEQQNINFDFEDDFPF